MADIASSTSMKKEEEIAVYTPLQLWESKRDKKVKRKISMLFEENKKAEAAPRVWRRTNILVEAFGYPDKETEKAFESAGVSYNSVMDAVRANPEALAAYNHRKLKFGDPQDHHHLQINVAEDIMDDFIKDKRLPRFLR